METLTGIQVVTGTGRRKGHLIGQEKIEIQTYVVSGKRRNERKRTGQDGNTDMYSSSDRNWKTKRT